MKYCKHVCEYFAMSVAFIYLKLVQANEILQ